MEIQLEQIDVKNIIENNSNVVFDFYAEWCGPCQTLLPTINKLADELKSDVTIKKINVDDYPELAAKFNVRNIPTLIFFKNGEPADRHTGLITEGNLRSKIDRLK
ncbi:thioredoxin [Polaribacter undariae]|uniref:Thioredoxin n=1 Tax=Polaribacter sejongensis TaxID=985043 RepID=A0AAJ1QUP3_9FLAO|nr:thioredoxin [Polaribacter undariae]MDN3618377.1 thioredoxin [Polaribacter undariae]UWD30639.1 thioredoxin [Polaribacter undariae]